MNYFGRRRKKLPTFLHPSVEYRVVFESLFLGTFLLVATVSILLFISYFLLHNHHVIGRILVCGIALLYLAVIQTFWNRQHTSLASKLLVLFYFGIASAVLYIWGIDTPFGMLSFSIAIVLAGILLGARYTIYLAGLAIVVVFTLQLQVYLGYVPPLTHSTRPTVLGDTIAYCTLLSILALISWLFGSQTQRLLFKNRQAEKALLKEKESLEIRVAERTEQLQKAQLKEMRQLYQFAEMGQLSAALLHDLANHLSVLTFDIADLKKQQHTEAIKRAEESVGYLEQAVHQVRKQLRGESEKQLFNATSCIEDTLKLLTEKATKSGVTIKLNTPENPPFINGDPLRLNHILTILVRNGIEAYGKVSSPNKTVVVTIESAKKKVRIHVKDEGIGIPTAQRNHLFTPVKSSKKEGLGIGLFIANKIAETHFKGTLLLNPTTDYTEFTLELPKAHP